MPRKRVRSGMAKTFMPAPAAGPGRACRWRAAGSASTTHQLARRPRPRVRLGDPAPRLVQVEPACRSTTRKATSRLPHSASGTPSTSAAATAGCSRSRRATAGAGTLTPPVTTMSSSRPSTWSRPSSSMRAASEVRNHPSTSASAVSAGSPSYPSNSIGPAIRSRPCRVDGQADPVQPDPVVDAAAGGLRRAVRRHDRHPATRPPARAVPASTGPPPTRTVRNVRSAAVSAASSSIRCSWVGTSETKSRSRVAVAAATEPCSSSRVGGCPATSDRTTTCSPATYDAGRASSQRPAPPSRRSVAATDASTAARDSTTRLGSPEDPDVSTTTGSASSAASHRPTDPTTSRVVPVGLTGRQ